MTSLSMTGSPAVAIALIGLPEPHASRLVEVVQLRTSAVAQVIEHLTNIPHDAWILTTPEWTERVVDYVLGLPAGHPERIAVLWGTRPETAALQSFRDQGLVVLTGPLPGPVIAWAEDAVRIAPAPEDSFAWNEDPAPDETAALVWGEPLEAPPSVRSPKKAAVSSVMPVEAEPPAWPASVPSRAQDGRVIAVYSSGGGVGKTTTAVYLATIAVQRRLAVNVLEMDEDRRGILTYWNQKPRNGGLDAIPAADWDDPGRLADRLASMAVAVHPRLTILPMAGTVTGLQYPLTHADSAAAHLLSWARQHSAWTWVDLPARLRDGTILAVLKSVDQIIWVIEPTELMLDSSRLYLDILEQLGPDGVAIVRKVSLLVNKVERARTARLDPRAMSEALGVPLLGSIAANSVKYLSGINQHHIEPTPEWEGVADRIGLPNPKAASATRSGGWLRGRSSRTEDD